MYIYGLLPVFLFLELTLIRFSLRAASCGKYLAGPYHDERFGSDFSKVSTASSAVPFFLSLGFHLCPFHIDVIRITPAVLEALPLNG